MSSPRQTTLRRAALCAILGLGACSDPTYQQPSDDSGARLQADASSPEQVAAERGDAATVRDATTANDASSTPATPADAALADGAPESVADAAVVVEAGTAEDAGVQPGPALPAWAAPLLGQYGIRARFYGRSVRLGTGGLTEWTMLGTFSFDAARNEVLLSTKLCAAVGTNSFVGIMADSAPVSPRSFPERVAVVHSEAGVWWTENAPLAIGFSEQPLVPCATPGARVKRADVQSWLSDNLCTCPSDPNQLPNHWSDCRINDADNDGQAAITVSFTGAVQGKFYVRNLDSSRIVQGVIDPIGRHHDASYAASADMLQLGCGDAPCQLDPLRACDAALNPVRVSPLSVAGDATVFSCDDVLNRKDSLFGTEPSVFPASGC